MKRPAKAGARAAAEGRDGAERTSNAKRTDGHFVTPRGPWWQRESGSRRMAERAMRRALAGPPPELPPRQGNGRNWVRRELEKRRILHGILAGDTRRQMMAAIEASESTVKRRLREVREDLWRQQAERARLGRELLACLDAVARGESPPPLSEERRRELSAFGQRIIREKAYLSAEAGEER